MATAFSTPAPLLRHIQDLNHQVWILQDQTLTAVPRKHNMVPATVALIPCQHLNTLDADKGTPMYLGLETPNLSLFCANTWEQPMLQLEEKSIMALYHHPEPLKPFLFYHNESGRTSTFESVAFPGWFIAVCSSGGCPLFLTQELGKAYTTDFELTLLH
ncbi:interleukin-36 alpha [Ochotona princeps]|uniref:interleukin-36 alpha n=1 Tax=Ochotona princeps TaxID=9978 RepID=UPI002714A920|nr:interleukin-36 alpha [Ochotona princeps]